MQVLELATEARQTRFYQDVLEEGKQVGLQEGLQEGRQVGLREGLKVGLQEGRAEEGRSLILRQLNRRVGTIVPELKTKIEALTIAQLEDLGEALLDFASVTDLEAWLAQVQIR
jgi:predicted transposase YdaD